MRRLDPHEDSVVFNVTMPAGLRRRLKQYAEENDEEFQSAADVVRTALRREFPELFRVGG